jgi:hypothetical protein
VDWQAVAHFIPAHALPLLCEAAEIAAPGEPDDRYDSVLDAVTHRRAAFPHSGACVAVALAFLDESGIDVHAAHQEKAERLTARREASHAIFTRGLARSVLPRFRAARIGVAALVRYDATLRGDGPPADPERLKAAVRFVHDVLASVSPGEEAVLVIRLADARAAAPAEAPRPHGFAERPSAANLRPAW